MAESLAEATQGANIGQTTTEGMPDVNLPKQQSVVGANLTHQQKLAKIMQHPQGLAMLKQNKTRRDFLGYATAIAGTEVASRVYNDNNLSIEDKIKVVNKSASQNSIDMFNHYSELVRSNIPTSKMLEEFLFYNQDNIKTSKDQSMYKTLHGKLMNKALHEEREMKRNASATEKLSVENKQKFHDAKNTFYQAALWLEDHGAKDNNEFEQLIYKYLGGTEEGSNISAAKDYVYGQETQFKNIGIDEFNKTMDRVIDKILEHKPNRELWSTVNVVYDEHGNPFEIAKDIVGDMEVKHLKEAGVNLVDLNLKRKKVAIKNILRGWVSKGISQVNSIKPMSTIEPGPAFKEQTLEKIEGF